MQNLTPFISLHYSKKGKLNRIKKMASTITGTSIATNEPTPILTRVERLDLMMSYLEEMKGNSNYKVVMMNSSRASTTSSGTTSEGGGGNSSSVNSSPKSMEKRCRPIDDVVMETQVKGSLIERVDQLEARLLKLEEEIENERKRETEEGSPRSDEKVKKHRGLKSLIKSCVRGKLETKE